MTSNLRKQPPLFSHRFPSFLKIHYTSEYGTILSVGSCILDAKQKHFGYERCKTNQKQHCKQVGTTRTLISAETKKLLYQKSLNDTLVYLHEYGT